VPSSSSSRRARQAAAVTASLEQAALAAGARGTDLAPSSTTKPTAPSQPQGRGTTDPLVGELRRAGLLPLLVLHYVSQEPCYGNQLMDRIGALTAGAVAVNPNTMYPLLRSMEAKGLIAGAWEHPERRSRRFYRLTEAGEAERSRMAEELTPHLDRIATTVDLIRRELLDR
jgi:PadR family transcriptional regulator